MQVNAVKRFRELNLVKYGASCRIWSHVSVRIYDMVVDVGLIVSDI